VFRATTDLGDVLPVAVDDDEDDDDPRISVGRPRRPDSFRTIDRLLCLDH